MPPFLPRKRLRSPDEESPESTPASKKSKKTPSSSSARKPTLFDALDAPSVPRTSKAFLEKLANANESELSSLETTPEFDDVPISNRKKHAEEEDDDDEDEDDFEFEDVQLKHTPYVAQPKAPALSGDLNLTLRKDTRVNITNPHGDKKGPSKIERKIRLDSHCMHVQMLMWHNALRNSWLCNAEVQAIILSHLPKEMWAEVDKWRARGIPGSKAEEKAEVSKKGKGKTKAGKNEKTRNGRDWSNAKKLEEGVVDMSHGDPLFKLLDRLSQWWKRRFHVTAPGLRKMGYMSLQRLDEEMKSFKDDESLPDPEQSNVLHGERIRDVIEFKTCAQSLQGSRDVGAQLFTALLRGLGLEARMIASLQPVGFGWSKGEEADERKQKKSSDAEESHAEDAPVKKVNKPRETKSTREAEEPIPAAKARGGGRGRKKSTPVVETESEAESQPSDDDSVVEITTTSQNTKSSKKFDKDLLFPHYWTEVLSPATNKYVAVDPMVLGIVATNAELLASFEPRGAKADSAKQVLAYVVGHSPDGTAKDVTVRYLKRHQWPGRAKGMRMNIEKIPIYGRNGKVSRYIEHDWFLSVMRGYERGSEKCPRTEIDDDEDTTDLKAFKPEKKEATEGNESLQSYKTSEKYVLERHLKREEALLSTAKHVKMFTIKGKLGAASTEEKVFLRKDVVSCKSTETWHKEGREPKAGEEPRKRVPYRAATTNRKRELAEAEAASGGMKPLQGLYSIDQTDFIIPPPIKDGIIPKNQYGNIDCYVPSMVPEGAIHLPYRGTMRVCKKLGIDFAEAVTGFEFGARMAVPIVTGVVVAEENAEMVMEQWHIDEAERVRKEDEKRQKFTLGMWRKFLMGLRIIERVRDEYGDEVDDNPDLLNPWTNKNSSGKGKSNEKFDGEAQRRLMDQREEETAGGFFPEDMQVEDEPRHTFFAAHGEEEEEGGGGFFPTNEEDEDGGGGFVVEDADDVQQEPKFVFPTPASLNGNPPGKEENEMAGNKPKAKKFQLKTPSSGKSVKAAPAKRGRGRPSLKDTPSAKATGKRKRDDSPHDEDDGESSTLSDVDMSMEEFFEKSGKPKKSNTKAKATSNSTPKTRATPKRKAANKKIKSPYFEISDEDDVDEDEE